MYLSKIKTLGLKITRALYEWLFNPILGTNGNSPTHYCPGYMHSHHIVGFESSHLFETIAANCRFLVVFSYFISKKLYCQGFETNFFKFIYCSWIR